MDANEEQTLMSEFIKVIHSEANNNLAPIQGEVIKAYEDKFVDVNTSMGILTYIPCICGKTVGSMCIVVFINGDSAFAIVDH